MTDDEAVVPFWVANGEPEPPLVVARLFVDRAPDEPAWQALAEERLRPLCGPERYDPTGAATLSDFSAAADSFGMLRVAASLGADRARLDDVVEAVLGVLRDGAADPVYGELSVDRLVDGHRTALDVALGRSAEESAAAGRAALRGYEWVTVCPAELAPRVDRRAFAEVTELPGGALLLRATATAGGWTAEAARAVFAALAPALPPGRPADRPFADLSRVVFADAADIPAGRLQVGRLPVGPPLLGREAVTAFALEAMRRGWVTAAGALTEEGERRLAERLPVD